MRIRSQAAVGCSDRGYPNVGARYTVFVNIVLGRNYTKRNSPFLLTVFMRYQPPTSANQLIISLK